MRTDPVRKIGKKMDKAKAKKWTKKYRDEHPNETRGWLYGDEILRTLLEDDGCEGIWFFKGTDDDGNEKLVLYPADADGNILKRNINSLGAAAGPNIDDPADFGQPCPDECPDNI